MRRVGSFLKGHVGQVEHSMKVVAPSGGRVLSACGLKTEGWHEKGLRYMQEKDAWLGRRKRRVHVWKEVSWGAGGEEGWCSSQADEAPPRGGSRGILTGGGSMALGVELRAWSRRRGSRGSHEVAWAGGSREVIKGFKVEKVQPGVGCMRRGDLRWSESSREHARKVKGCGEGKACKKLLESSVESHTTATRQMPKLYVMK
ncbi:hypothetical protein GOP47_0027197 [Adiantum capillus-veneris]|nr:hypothetical protein GOP47_0027197 [Adiantum capillus-veneris]